MPSPGGRAGWHFQPLCRWREQEAKRLLCQRSFGKRRNKGGEYGRLTSNVCLMSGRVCVSRVVCTFSLRTQCKEGRSAVMLVQTIQYFLYLIFKAPNKCYAWIHFTWLIGMHTVTTVPGQKWLLMNLNRNKEMIMLCCLCLWKADHLLGPGKIWSCFETSFHMQWCQTVVPLQITFSNVCVISHFQTVCLQPADAKTNRGCVF